jgi:hypothetical protein
MATVHLLSAAAFDAERNPLAHLDLEQLRAAAVRDRFRVHRTCDDPRCADIVLFVETIAYADHFQPVVRHPVYRAFKAKCYLFAATDKLIPRLPGVFASIERRWYSRAWTRSGFYPGVREDSYRRYDPKHAPTRLFSFVGSTSTYPVRRRLMELTHPDALLIDSHGESTAVARGEAPRLSTDEFRGRYVRAIEDSAFVLCPRGRGTSTFRLFEAMMLGRAPVIISDQWVPPEGPEWGSFSLRVRERDVDAIPGLLEARAADAERMGLAARSAWLDWFAEEAAFHRTVEWCLDLARFAPARTGLKRLAPYVQMLRPYHAARTVSKKLGHGATPRAEEHPESDRSS